MTCPTCEAHNDAYRRFCSQCGAFLIAPCGRCSFPNQVKDRFCGGCGEPLQAAQRDRPAANRKGSTANDSTSQPLALSASELSELLEKGPGSADSNLPNKVSQDDLDRLFGKAE